MRKLLLVLVLAVSGIINAQTEAPEQTGTVGDFSVRFKDGVNTTSIYYFGAVNGETVVKGANRGGYLARLRFGNFNGRGSSYIFFVTKEGQVAGEVGVDFIFNGDKTTLTNVKSSIDNEGDVKLQQFGEGFFKHLSTARFIHVRVVVDGQTSVFKFNTNGAQELIEDIIAFKKLYDDRQNPFAGADNPFQG